MLEDRNFNPDADVFRDNKTMNRSAGVGRFWDGDLNPGTRLS